MMTWRSAAIGWFCAFWALALTLGFAVAHAPKLECPAGPTVAPAAAAMTPAEEIEAWKEMAAALKTIAAQPRVGPVVREWLTVEEAAEYSGLPKPAIIDLIKQRKIFFIGRGLKTWRIQRSDMVSVISAYSFGAGVH